MWTEKMADFFPSRGISEKCKRKQVYELNIEDYTSTNAKDFIAIMRKRLEMSTLASQLLFKTIWAVSQKLEKVNH